MPGDGPRAGPSSAPELPRRRIAVVLDAGTRLGGRRVVLYVAPGDGPARAACIAGRRVGIAVARNRARRLLREAWRSVAPRTAEGIDLVLVARTTIRGAKAGDLIEELEGLLMRAGVLEE